MEPRLTNVINDHSQSFVIKKSQLPQNNSLLHYHREVELIHIKKAKGLQVIGNKINYFQSDKMVLIGAGLSHFWRFDERCVRPGHSKNKSTVQVFHFKENFWGDDFLNLPENKQIKSTLSKAKRGLEISGKTKDRVGELMDLAEKSEGTERIILLLEILTVISDCDEVRILATLGYARHFSWDMTDPRIQAVYDYLLKNFRRKVELDEIAEIANLCPHYFCRFIKLNLGITYTELLNEIRIGHACHLLVKNQTNIQIVASESGYNNFTYFYKCFNRIVGMSPLKYQQFYFKKPEQSCLIPQ
ncbi:AraC family transcriptional regulator [Negadavirga shengliensis]|uniref:AraC family transcriptional regulator n=1 Tax=Negadavirga shengliensis TaxID=1389218 RepID=A0ABV9T3X3_9BACT